MFGIGLEVCVLLLPEPGRCILGSNVMLTMRVDSGHFELTELIL